MAILGDDIVSGRSGVFTLARLSNPEGFWINGRRSQTRRQMSCGNKGHRTVGATRTVGSVRVTFRSCGVLRGLHFGLAAYPTGIVSLCPDRGPHRDLRGWLLRESVDDFLQRYEHKPMTQDDLAKPTLKKIVKQGNDGAQP